MLNRLTRSYVTLHTQNPREPSVFAPYFLIKKKIDSSAYLTKRIGFISFTIESSQRKNISPTKKTTMKANKSFAIIATLLLSAASLSLATTANASTNSREKLSTETSQIRCPVLWRC
jgi:hypothetical protein